MTLLELVNLARSEAGVADGDLTTLSGANAEAARFKVWVQREWLRLQAEQPNWEFLRLSGEFPTVAGQAEYTPQQALATDDGTSTGASILADWKRDSFRVSTDGTYGDEQILVHFPWNDYRNLYLYGSTRTQQTRPVSVAVSPSKTIWLGNVPDAVYLVNFEFFRAQQALNADADEPLMPTRFHEILAYRALMAYGIFMSAPEVIGRAESVLGPLATALVNDQLPGLELPMPMA